MQKMKYLVGTLLIAGTLSIVGAFAVAAGATPTPTPSATPTKKCCICIYDDSNPAHTTSFKNSCISLINSLIPGTCDSGSSDVWSATNAKSSNLPTGCSTMKIYWRGHGPEPVCDIVNSCTKFSPLCTYAVYISSGCQTLAFDGEEEAKKVAEVIRKNSPNCTVSVLANQCNGGFINDGSGKIVCEAAIRYTISKDCTKVEYGSCSPTGSVCLYNKSGGSNSQQCLDTSDGNKLKTQNCCPNGKWAAPGAACPTPSPSSTPAP